MSGNKVLVTGASGFVGWELVRQFAQGNTEVVSVTHRADAGLANSVIIPDFTDEAAWQSALQGCRVVIHLAARVHVMNDQASNPLDEYIAVNLHGTMALARAAVAAGVRRFVYVSTIKVNGEGSAKAYTENDTCKPDDPYAISKLQAEDALKNLAGETGLELVIVRPPLIYGPGVKANFLSMMKVIDKGIPLPLGSISNKRSLIYLGNLVDALKVCAIHPQAVGQTFLLSDGEDVSTPELISKIARLMHRHFALYQFPLCIMAAVARCMGKYSAYQRLTGSLVVDSSKVRHILGWVPPYRLDEGLQHTIASYLESKGR